MKRKISPSLLATNLDETILVLPELPWACPTSADDPWNVEETADVLADRKLITDLEATKSRMDVLIEYIGNAASQYPSLGDEVDMIMTIQSVEGDILQEARIQECFGSFELEKQSFGPAMAASIAAAVSTFEYDHDYEYDFGSGTLETVNDNTKVMLVLRLERVVPEDKLDVEMSSDVFASTEQPWTDEASRQGAPTISRGNLPPSDAGRFQLAPITQRGMPQPKRSRKRKK